MACHDGVGPPLTSPVLHYWRKHSLLVFAVGRKVMGQPIPKTPEAKGTGSETTSTEEISARLGQCLLQARLVVFVKCTFW